MSSRRLLIAGIVGGALAGLTLLGAALALVAVEGAALSGSMMATVILGAAATWALDATWLAFAFDRLRTTRHDSGGEDDEEGEGGKGWGRPGPGPAGPSSPPEGADWWPEFERELRSHMEERERAPTT
ncbi:MAG: hypothetical protein ACRDMJ_08275 [Solirubrobacteraceae bacterium]